MYIIILICRFRLPQTTVVANIEELSIEIDCKKHFRTIDSNLLKANRRFLILKTSCIQIRVEQTQTSRNWKITRIYDCLSIRYLWRDLTSILNLTSRSIPNTNQNSFKFFFIFPTIIFTQYPTLPDGLWNAALESKIT